MTRLALEMAKPLRSQLNQVRAWVQQGRTDAWIAHQLDASTSELREFRRRHELDAAEEPAEDTDLRDEIEAEIEAAMSEEAAEEPDEDEDHEDGEGDGDPEADGDGDGAPKRRRRRRRGGRGRRPRPALQASFDHGTDEGFGLWLDPAVQDDPVYSEHWAGHRPVEITIEADRIVIRRSGDEASPGSQPD